MQEILSGKYNYNLLLIMHHTVISIFLVVKIFLYWV